LYSLILTHSKPCFMRNLFCLTCFILFFSIEISAQDPIFLNANQSLIYFNPSFAGSNGGVRNQLSYSRQWPLLSERFISYANSFDMYVKPLRAGVALTYMIDDVFYGKPRTTTLSFAYAQHLVLGAHIKIIPSVQFSYRQKSLDVSHLSYGDPIDPRMGIIWNNPSVVPARMVTSVSASAGMLVNVRKDLYIGAYLFHMNQPDEGLMGTSKLPSRFLFHTSYNLKVSEKTRFQFFYRFE
jgi:type IX secretion system PorP/SprF family membrane protein